MAFGKKKKKKATISQKSPSPEPQDPINVEELSGGGDNEELSVEDHSRKNTKPLLKEVNFLGSGKGKNPGGTKQFQCNHCKKSFSGSYTRIFNHFFGPPPGKPAGITRCPVISSSREELRKLRKRIEDDEKAGLSPSITKSTISNKGAAATVKPIVEAFGTMERHQVDLAITRALCSNGIPFNVLRNPDFIAMVKAINHAPSDYSPPPYDRARTTLLDDCYREVEKELAPVKDTWTTQGISIISDGWTNVKHQPLINVVASNSRGSMFMYADNFSGVEKTGKEIADYLLKSIDEVGPSNVLQVVTDNAANCKAAGKEIEKNALLWFGRVLEVKELVVSGKIYHLNLEIIDAGKKRVYEAKVWVKPCINFKELQEFKRIFRRRLHIWRMNRTRAAHFRFHFSKCFQDTLLWSSEVPQAKLWLVYCYKLPHMNSLCMMYPTRLFSE